MVREDRRFKGVTRMYVRIEEYNRKEEKAFLSHFLLWVRKHSQGLVH